MGGQRDLVIRDVRSSPCDLNDAEQMENCITNEKEKILNLGYFKFFFLGSNKTTVLLRKIQILTKFRVTINDQTYSSKRKQFS